jgi:hypothetical protein
MKIRVSTLIIETSGNLNFILAEAEAHAVARAYFGDRHYALRHLEAKSISSKSDTGMMTSVVFDTTWVAEQTSQLPPESRDDPS